MRKSTDLTIQAKFLRRAIVATKLNNTIGAQPVRVAGNTCDGRHGWIAFSLAARLGTAIRNHKINKGITEHLRGNSSHIYSAYG